MEKRSLQITIIAIAITAIMFEAYSASVGLCIVFKEYFLIFIAIILVSLNKIKFKPFYLISIVFLLYWLFHEINEFINASVCIGKSLWLPLMSLILLIIGSHPSWIKLNTSRK